MNLVRAPRGRRRLNVAFLALGIAALAIGASAPAPPRLELSTTTLDWGKCGHRQEITKTVTVTNRGGEPLKIEGLKSSCSCTTVKIDKHELAPNESTEISVVMSTGTVMGYLQKYLQFQTNDPQHKEVKIPVLARVHDDVKAEPWVLPQFTAVAEGPAVTQEFTLQWRAKPDTNLKLENLRCNNKAMSVSAVPLKTGALIAGYKIAVTIQPPAAEGLFNGTILAELNGLPWEFRVYGQVFVGIVVQPTYFQFGRIDDSETVRSSIVLTSADGLPFRLLDIRCTPDILAFDVRSNDDGTEHTVTARIAFPDRTTRFFGKVQIRTDHPKKALVEATCLGFWPTEGKKSG